MRTDLTNKYLVDQLNTYINFLASTSNAYYAIKNINAMFVRKYLTFDLELMTTVSFFDTNAQFDYYENPAKNSHTKKFISRYAVYLNDGKEVAQKLFKNPKDENISKNLQNEINSKYDNNFIVLEDGLWGDIKQKPRFKKQHHWMRLNFEN